MSGLIQVSPMLSVLEPSASARALLPEGSIETSSVVGLLGDRVTSGTGTPSHPALSVLASSTLVRAGTLIAVASAVRFRGKGGYFMIYPSRGQIPRKVTAFRDFLAEYLKSPPMDAY